MPRPVVSTTTNHDRPARGKVRIFDFTTQSPEGQSTIRLKKCSSVASRTQRERCDVTYALLPTVAKFRWFMLRCCGSHRNFAKVDNNAYVASQRSRCLRDATDDHF